MTNNNDIEKQFAGNYVRLVNQCRDLQAEITVKDRMIEDFINYQLRGRTYCYDWEYKKDYDEIYKKIEQKAITKLVAEQNKKAADNTSI